MCKVTYVSYFCWIQARQRLRASSVIGIVIRCSNLQSPSNNLPRPCARRRPGRLDPRLARPTRFATGSSIFAHRPLTSQPHRIPGFEGSWSPTFQENRSYKVFHRDSNSCAATHTAPDPQASMPPGLLASRPERNRASNIFYRSSNFADWPFTPTPQTPRIGFKNVKLQCLGTPASANVKFDSRCAQPRRPPWSVQVGVDLHKFTP